MNIVYCFLCCTFNLIEQVVVLDYSIILEAVFCINTEPCMHQSLHFCSQIDNIITLNSIRLSHLVTGVQSFTTSHSVRLTSVYYANAINPRCQRSQSY